MYKTVVCHLFYPAVAIDLLHKLKTVTDNETAFFFNVQGNTEAHKKLYDEIKNLFPGAKILTTPNKGRDIGGKLLLIGLLLQLGVASDYTLIIHDKKSPHLGNGNHWRDGLYRVIDPNYITRVFQAFEKPSTGIVGAAQFIQNEYDPSGVFLCNCSRQIETLLKQYDIHISSYDYVAGNIFWIRTSLLRNFFSRRSILQIRAELEPGNALDFSQGTYIHSWERMMSWIAPNQGYTINGI